MCGLESAIYERNGDKIDRAVRFDLMLHAFMFTQSGIPMLYSGDEIGQLNDYTYKDDPDKREDSRYIHRGAFKWDLAELIKEKGTAQQQIFDGLSKLETIRRSHKVFDSTTPTYTYDVKDDAILGMLRENDEERFIALFNFADQDRTAWILEDGTFTDLFTGEEVILENVIVRAHDFLWLSRSKKQPRKRQKEK
jgi:amylosucrase